LDLIKKFTILIYFGLELRKSYSKPKIFKQIQVEFSNRVSFYQVYSSVFNPQCTHPKSENHKKGKQALRIR